MTLIDIYSKTITSNTREILFNNISSFSKFKFLRKTFQKIFKNTLSRYTIFNLFTSWFDDKYRIILHPINERETEPIISEIHRFMSDKDMKNDLLMLREYILFVPYSDELNILINKYMSNEISKEDYIKLLDYLVNHEYCLENKINVQDIIRKIILSESDYEDMREEYLAEYDVFINTPDTYSIINILFSFTIVYRILLKYC